MEQGERRLSGRLIWSGCGFVAQAVEPSITDSIRQRRIRAHGLLDTLDGCIGSFPDDDGLGRVLVQSLRRVGVDGGLSLSGFHAGFPLGLGIVPRLDVEPASEAQNGHSGPTG